MRKECYDCARVEWDPEGATCGINGLHVDRPSLGCNKRVSEKRMTNGDRVRNMTDEELADVLQGQCVCCAYQLTGCAEKECFDGVLSWLKQANRRVVKMTNGDKIRQMTDEELAEFLDELSGCRLCDGYKRGICNGECLKGHLAWLRKEVDEDD